MDGPLPVINDPDYVDPNSKEIENAVKPVQYLPSKKVSIVLLSLFLVIAAAGLLITQLNTQNYRETVKPKQLLLPTSTPTFRRTPTTSPTSFPPFTTTDSISSPPGDWNTYNNSDHKFSLKYPPTYSFNQSSGKELTFDKLANLVKFDHNDKDSTFEINLDTHTFNLEYLKKYAPTGSENLLPNPTKIGEKTFYYYGAGGGGVNYPDQYFYNLNGQILKFVFWGPYENEKTPTEEAKKVEVQILSTFHITE